MADRKMGIRITIVVEDQLLDRFCREALMALGYHRREIRVRMSPAGRGSGKNWVNKQVVVEVNALRSQGYQSLAVLVGSDVDELTLAERIRQLEDSLATAQAFARTPQERIAYWLPKWHVETWMSALAGETVDENTQYKNQLGEVDAKQIGRAFVDRYRQREDLGLPSMANAFAETQRIEA
jgi:hypothetical protein